MKKILWLAALAAPLLLSACSGSDDAAPPPATSERPADVNDSPEGLIAYIKRLIAETEAGQTDDKEPLGLTGFDPKTPEDTEPEPVS